MIAHLCKTPPVAQFVQEVIEGLGQNQGGSLAVLRNGGFEQWIRNHILIRSEAMQTWGFTEAKDGDVDRTDLLFRCNDCLHATGAVELKTNFILQSPSTITSSISKSLDQLDGYLNRLPSFLVYCLTHLRGNKNSLLVEAQAASSPPPYKLFDTSRDAWPIDRPTSLPSDYYACSNIVQAHGAEAEIRVWIASVAETPARPDSRQLSFLSHAGTWIELAWKMAHFDNNP